MGVKLFLLILLLDLELVVNIRFIAPTIFIVVLKNCLEYFVKNNGTSHIQYSSNTVSSEILFIEKYNISCLLVLITRILFFLTKTKLFTKIVLLFIFIENSVLNSNCEEIIFNLLSKSILLLLL